jgi:hypothetical protein
LPTASAEVVNVATPLESVPVPMVLPLSRKVTVPLGVPAPGKTAETLTVNVTNCVNPLGLGDEAIVVEEFDLLTICAPAVSDLVLVAKVASPE